MNDTLNKLADVLEARKSENADTSYTASLYAKGLDAILQKVGEEATETILAAKGGDNRRIVSEVADLWFHTLVLLAASGLRPNAVLEELERRFGVSGLAEKAARSARDA